MNLSSNKKAYHDYFIVEKFEAGVELKGTEVKSAKLGKISIKEAYVKVVKNELFVINMNINKYEFGNIHNMEERRSRKLLMHKKEIAKLEEKVNQDGFALLAISVYTKRGRVKIEIALAKGKKNYDKRDVLAKKDQNRSIERALKERSR